MDEQQFRDRGFGKWSRRSIPHKGWTCIDMHDLGDVRMICEMCETAEIRYVHVMTHPDFESGEGELEVGCICAGNMEQDYAAAELREKQYRRRQKNPRIDFALSWVEAANEILAANETVKYAALKLKPHEAEFVCDICGRAQYRARPRARKPLRLSPKQYTWFKDIYRRIVGRRLELACVDDVTLARQRREMMEEEPTHGMEHL
jgi:hypothetical protein